MATIFLGPESEANSSTVRPISTNFPVNCSSLERDKFFPVSLSFVAHLRSDAPQKEP